jgi:hypothetical protein
MKDVAILGGLHPGHCFPLKPLFVVQLVEDSTTPRMTTMAPKIMLLVVKGVSPKPNTNGEMNSQMPTKN